MEKEEIAERIEGLIKEYKEKKIKLENVKKESEKLQKNRKVRKYIELNEIISILNKELFTVIQEVTKLQEKYREID